MAILNINSIQSYNGESFSISKPYGIPILTFSNGDKLEDLDEYIDSYSPKLIENNYNSVLIGGLGLGLMPQWIVQNTTCSTVDVVEINSELISWTNSSEHLSTSVNIIQADILTYIPSKTYDLIVVDIWWNCGELFNQQVNTVTQNLSEYLNVGGCLYIPLYPPSTVFK